MKSKKSNSPITREVLKKVLKKELKEELQKLDFVTHNELKEESQKLQGMIKAVDDKANRTINDLLDTKARLGRIEENMFTKQEGQKLLEHMDAWAQRFETYDRKAVVHDARLNENETQLKDHETRILHLEMSFPK